MEEILNDPLFLWTTMDMKLMKIILIREKALILTQNSNNDNLESVSETTSPDIFIEEQVGWMMSGMFCGAHTCQLACKDVNDMHEDILIEIRSFVKELKKIQYDIYFVNINRARIDVETRWCSTYTMLNDLETGKETLKKKSKRRNRIRTHGISYQNMFLCLNQFMMQCKFSKKPILPRVKKYYSNVNS